jgi:DNA-binding MarR family transcriptional regulator
MSVPLPRLDPAYHAPARIAIASRLVASERMRFAALRIATGLTPGNLATHLDALEKAGYVTQRDAIVARRRGRVIAMTEEGRAAWRAYVAALEALVAALRERPAPPPKAGASRSDQPES